MLRPAATNWYLASPNTGNANNVANVNGNGNVNGNNNANNWWGVPLGLCKSMKWSSANVCETKEIMQRETVTFPATGK